jgi:tetratricopeptide (TPR) repeat protein
LLSASRFGVCCVLVCALWLLLLSGYGHSSPSEPFQQARAAHADGDLRLAAVLFLQALEQRESNPEAAGPTAQAIRYNLGVTLFQLDQTDTAREQFELLAEDPEWRALATYNLGLIAVQQAQPAKARQQFQRVLRYASDDDLRRLAMLQLERLPEESLVASESPGSAPWRSLIELGAGRDDNVRLTGATEPDLPSDEADTFGEVLALGSRHFRRHNGAALRLDLLGYYRGYQSLSDYNLGMAGATLWYQPAARHWQPRAGLHVDAQFAGGEHYANTGTLHLEASRPFGPVTAQLRNSFSQIAGSSDFDFISGWQNRSRLSLHLTTGAVRWLVSYQLELNDRDDLQVDDAFFSYSATRHQGQLRARFSPSTRTEVEVQIDYRDSRYNDANEALDEDDNLRRLTREETRLGGRLRLSFRPADGWALFAEYQHQDNDANFQRYDWRSRQWLFGLEVWR